MTVSRLAIVAVAALLIAVAALVVAVLSWVNSADEGAVDAPDSAAEPGGYAVYLVEQALDMYESEGRDATIAYYNSPESLDGPWYVFILDMEDGGITLSHAAVPARVGTRSSRADLTGYDFGAAFDAVPEGGRQWVSYTFLNPQTGTEQVKHTWVEHRDGLLFGSGWYERYFGVPLTKSDPAAFTVAFVDQAIERYEREGREASFAYFNSEESEDGPWYAFVLEDGRIAAHPTEDLLGEEVAPLTDINGYNYGRDILAAPEEGAWITYVFLNRESERDERKHSWVVQHDGLLFGSGWYERDY